MKKSCKILIVMLLLLCTAFVMSACSCELLTYQLTVTTTEGGTVAGSGNFSEGASVAAMAVPKAGYKFVGWYIDGEFQSDLKYYIFNMPANPVIIEGRFEPLQQFKLEVRIVGGDGDVKVDGVSFRQGKFTEESDVTLNAVIGSGYFFAGWFTSETEPVLESFDQNYSFKMPSSDYSLTLLLDTADNGMPGNGSERYPFFIMNKAQMLRFAQNVNTIDNYSKDKYFALGADIDLEGMEFAPVGYLYSGDAERRAFTGIFDGRGYSVNDFIITGNSLSGYENLSGSYYSVGLFGYAVNASIKNLSVTGVEIDYTADNEIYVGGILGCGKTVNINNCSVIGNIYVENDLQAFVGGIVGVQSWGEIKDCIFIGDVSVVSGSYVLAGGIVGDLAYVDIAGCFSAGNVYAYGTSGMVYAGGIAGDLVYSPINRCASTSNVTAEGAMGYAGGIAGYAHSSDISECFSTGDIVSKSSDAAGYSYAGGIAGYFTNGNEIDNCYSLGNITAEAVNESIAGGIIGKAASSVSINSCYSAGAITATAQNEAYAGGILGDCTFAQIAGSLSIGNITAVGVISYAGSVLNNSALISNFYYYENQVLTGGMTFADGTPCDAAALSDSSFYNDTLLWDKSIWNYTDVSFIGADNSYESNKHPKLENNDRTLFVVTVVVEGAGGYSGRKAYYYSGEAVELTAEAETANYFAGWYVYNAGTNEYEWIEYEGAEYGFIMPHANVTLYLVFSNDAGFDEELDENASRFSAGNGTVRFPFLIMNKPQMLYFQNKVNTTDNYSSGKFFMLGADIDLEGMDFMPIGYDTWEGNTPRAFTGTFNGAYKGIAHTVHSYNVIVNPSAPYYCDLGLFGYADNYAVIKNLIVDDFGINITDSRSINAGGIAGYISGSVLNCTSTGNIDATSTSNKAYAGGIAGYISGSVLNCTSTGSTSASSTTGNACAGGIAGCGYDIISNCVSTGNISATGTNHAYAGGIAGYADESISYCVSTGNISATSEDTYAQAGGIAGYVTANISYCGSTGNISATSESANAYAGGVSGYVYGTVTGCYSNGTVTASSPVHGMAAGIVAMLGNAASKVINCFSTADITADTNAASVAAEMLAGAEIENCYYYVAQVLTAASTLAQGNECTALELESIEFYVNTLLWSQNVWNLDSLAFDIVNKVFETDMNPILRIDGKVFYRITVDITGNGTFTGVLEYEEGKDLSLTAVANTGHRLVEWTLEDGTSLGNNATLTYTATGDITFKLIFEAITYNITATANPVDGGTISGAGIYNHNASVTLAATANTFYKFVKWIDAEGDDYSFNSTITFFATADIALTAIFSYIDFEGSGTVNDPYLIKNIDELQLLATRVNGGNSYEGKYFALANNLDLSSIANWTPIGSFENPFAADFNGQYNGVNYTISGMKITALISGVTHYGLFGYTTAAANIRNLGLTSVGINFTGTPDGTTYVGGIVGRSLGTINQCYVEGGTINANLSTAMVYVGGIVGANSGAIANAYCTASVTVTNALTSGTRYAYAGGISGHTSANITNCYATGAVTAANSGTGTRYVYSGGIAGYQGSGTIQNCFRLGTTSYSTSNNYYSGYVVGYRAGTMTNNYRHSNASRGGYSTTSNNETAPTSSNDAWFSNMSSYFTALGWDVLGTWDLSKLSFNASSDSFNAGGNPKLNLSTYGNGSVEGPYEIWTKEQLSYFRDLVNAGNNFSGKYIVLCDNLDIASFTSWTPIGTSSSITFAGIFDGQSYTISNLTYDSSSQYYGLFGYVAATATIKNLGLLNVAVKVAGSYDSINYVGALIGYNNGGIIEQCYAEGTIYGSVAVSGLGSGNIYVGGLAGYSNGGVIRDCYTRISVRSYTIDDGSLFTGTRYAISGGIVAVIASSTLVTRCYATGDVSAEHNYNSGTRYAYAGGIAAYINSGATVSNCLAIGNSTLVNAGSSNCGAGYIAGYNGGTISNCSRFDGATLTGSITVTTGTSRDAAWLNDANNYYSTLSWSALVWNLSDLEFSGNNYTANGNPRLGAMAEGTLGNPLVITTVADLQYISEQVNSGNTFAGKYILLGADITLSSAWTPIGTATNPFAGNFSGYYMGTYYTISNLFFTYSTGITYYGLFGYISANAIISDLTITLGTINMSTNSTGGYYVGAVAGYNDGGTVTGCSVSGTISAATTAAATHYAGGIVGYNTGIIEACSNATTMSATSSGSTSNVYVGGIAGLNTGIIQNCYNTANISANVSSTGTGTRSVYSGGIVGYMNGGEINYCYSIGLVSASGNSGGTRRAFAGGITGYLNGGTVNGCINTGNITISSYTTTSGNHGAGYIVGNVAGGSISNCYYLATATKTSDSNTTEDSSIFSKTADELAEEVFYTTLGWLNSIWDFTNIDVGVYPTLIRL